MSSKTTKSRKTKKPSVKKPKVARKVKERAPPKKVEKAVHEKVEKKAEKVEKIEKVEKVERIQPERPARPEGQVPTPRVTARHDVSVKERDARGYSRSELLAVGVSKSFAKSLGVPIDIRRRSMISGNVEKLKSWIKGKGERSGRRDRADKKK